ncbi:MAG: hypothetical protein ACYDA8_18180 [Deferrisomatales bacterium]
MTTAAALKAFAPGRLGADLCGVAGVARFAGAPAGFHPADVYPGVRAVVALAKALPEGVMRSPSPVPYTAAGDWALDGVTADQKRCRASSSVVTPKGYPFYTYNRCRRLCPHGPKRPGA